MSLLGKPYLGCSALTDSILEYKMTRKINQQISFIAIRGLFFTLLILLCTPIEAAEVNQMEARELRKTGQILSLEKIIAIANSIKAGNILETELERKGAGYWYEVELLDTKGQVWELKLDAKTGKLIKLESED